MLKQVLVAGAALAVLIGCEERGTQPPAPSGGIEAPDTGRPPPTTPSTPSPEARPDVTPGATPPGQPQDQPGASQIDPNFLKEAAMVNLVEVDLGRLASEQAQSPEVKAFGQRMIQDHSQARDTLSQIAQRHNLTPPDQIDQTEQSAKDRLTDLSGEDFDRQYIQKMVSDHQKAVALFERHASMAKNPEVKDHIQQFLPVLREHLQMAQDLQQRMATPGQPGAQPGGQPEPGRPGGGNGGQPGGS